MKPLAVVCYLLLISTNMYSQYWDFEKPDYDSIEININDTSSSLFYPVLWTRYHQGDTMMTTNELRHMYFGYQFMDEYQPYSKSAFQDSIQNLFATLDSITVADMKNLLRFGDSILIIDPFNMEVIEMQQYIFQELHDLPSAELKYNQLGMIIKAMQSSGDGASLENPIYVIHVGHEYDMINYFGFKASGNQTLIGSVDEIKIEENAIGLDALYFEVSASFNHLSKVLQTGVKDVIEQDSITKD